MRPVRRRPWFRVAVVAAVLLTLVVGGYGMYLASLAGELPWQEEPTRIPVEPFADIPGFDPQSIGGARPEATPAP